jgi:hypothetical protein
MMDCTQFRRAILADPHELGPDMRVHEGSCAECAAFAERVRRFEDRLDRALRVDLPIQARSATVVPLRPQAQREAPSRGVERGWLAAAASLVLGVAAGALWLVLPGRSLAAAVVDHMAEEPAAWSTEAPVSEPLLERVLSESHVRLRPGTGLISYANSCEFRGHRVPHLVVQTAAGPVTVMVLTHETTHITTHFDEQGYRGTIVPVPGHGSLAVLERGPTAVDADAVAGRVLAAMAFTP